MSFEDKTSPSKRRENLERAIEALEAQRSILGDQIIDIAQASMREKLTQLEAETRLSHELQERKLITVLFADVSGFTAMAEAMDHEIVSSVINSLWSRVDKAIRDHGGRIDKHIGDAVMALFGTPTVREDDPERAIRAALQIQAKVQEWKKEFSDSIYSQQSQSQNIQLRIGINTGPVVAGDIGSAWQPSKHSWREGDRVRRTRTCGQDAGQLPTSHKLVGQTADAAQEFLPAAKR